MGAGGEAFAGALGLEVSGIEAVGVCGHYKNAVLEDSVFVSVRTQVLLFVTEVAEGNCYVDF